MLPSAPSKYLGPWPSSGHIVFAESRGNEKLLCTSSDPPLGRQQAHQGLIWGPNNDQFQSLFWSKYFLILRNLIT